MALKLYRRHNTSCIVHTLNLGAEDKRYYLDCECPLWIAGNGVPRTSLDTTDLKIAEAKRQRMLNDATDTEVLGIRISDAIAKYMAERKTVLGLETAGQHQILLDRLSAYCAARGARHMSELTVDLLEDFKINGLPALKDTTRKVAVVKLRSFLREAFRREWIARPLGDQVRAFEAAHEQKVPYTDAEVSCILAGALKLRQPVGAGHARYAKHPETFRLLLELMLETGMRVSDAVRFDPKRLRKGESLWVYSFLQKKRKRNARPRTTEVFISDTLKAAIEQCAWLTAELPFWFVSATEPERHVLALMNSIGKRCGIADCRPHRLRDTCAVRLLLRGVPIGDVSKLLGHSSVTTTEQFYAAWVPERVSRLERVLAASGSRDNRA
jgi:integrase